jgi:hypothetical protein
MLLTELPSWQKLLAHRKTWEGVRMRELFKADPTRFERYSISLDDFLLDYSKI